MRFSLYKEAVEVVGSCVEPVDIQCSMFWLWAAKKIMLIHVAKYRLHFPNVLIKNLQASICLRAIVHTQLNDWQ